MRLKLIFIIALPAILISSCGSGGEEKEQTGPAKEDITKSEVYQKGLALVAGKKCLTCHAIDQTVTGPPYREIAKKYAGMPDTIISHLAMKVISGGNGVWGQVFMTPHPDLSREDAEAMVKYILLLKK